VLLAGVQPENAMEIKYALYQHYHCYKYGFAIKALCLDPAPKHPVLVNAKDDKGCYIHTRIQKKTIKNERGFFLPAGVVAGVVGGAGQ